MSQVETTTPVHEIERALFAIFRGSQGTKLHRQASRAAGVELDRAGFGALVSLGDQHLRMSELATRRGSTSPPSAAASRSSKRRAWSSVARIRPTAGPH